MSSVRLGCLDYEMSRRAICLGWGDVVSMSLPYASSLKGSNTYDFVICVVVLQYDKSSLVTDFTYLCETLRNTNHWSWNLFWGCYFYFLFFLTLGLFSFFLFFFSWNFHFLDIRHSRHLKLYNLSMICHSNNIKLLFLVMNWDWGALSDQIWPLEQSCFIEPLGRQTY